MRRGRRQVSRATLIALLGLSSTACLRALPVDPALLGSQALTSIVVAADGTPITSLHAEIDRRPTALADIPETLVQAVIAVEDRRFYEHDGVDVRGIARAAAADVASGSARQGGSTITQQLVKNTLVTPEKTLRRKVREAALARGLEQTLTKDQILERYLNTVYFGQGAYGVGAAARVYFGRTPDQLGLAESALLAGLVRSPATSDPVRQPDAARARRSLVLAAMVETGAITAAEAAEAEAEPLPRRALRDDTRYPAAYAVQDAVSTLLEDPRLGETAEDRRNALFRGGLRITLTIDLDQQALAERAVAQTLSAPNDPDAAMTVVQPGDGAIRAMVGGRDFFHPRDPQAKVNLARGGTTKRQAGSTFKLFTLVAALEAGIRLDDRFEAGARATLPCRCGGGPWQVDNYEGSAFGRITLREATERSVNTAYARVVQAVGKGDVDAGTAKVVAVAERFGIRGAGESRVRTEPAVTLGAQEVDTVQMAAAYATLAAGGVYARPYLVAEVQDSDGEVVLRNTPQRTQVVPAGIATLATEALRGVVERGTGVKADINRPVAGKTGTSTKYHDAWFVGYTPSLAAAVWMGVARKQVPMIPENGFRTIVAGGTFPTLAWARFVRTALAGTPVQDFADDGKATVVVKVDRVQGCLPNRNTLERDIVERTFLKGTEPTAVCVRPTAPAATVVPSVLGATADFARQQLSDVGFQPEVVLVYDPRWPDGVVVGQQPSSGATVEPGSRVVLQVSGGKDVRVPDLLGLDSDAARRQLSVAGLVAEVVLEPSCTGGASCAARLEAEAGRVWRQDVPAGRTVRVGTVVRLAVGPRYTPPPGPPPSPSSGPSSRPSSAPPSSPTARPSAG